MTTILLERETSKYWNLIKDAGNEVKLALITLLSSSMTSDGNAIAVQSKPLKARRLNAMTEDEMEKEMKGDPIPLSDSDEATPSEIVEANRGKMVKGLERWL